MSAHPSITTTRRPKVIMFTRVARPGPDLRTARQAAACLRRFAAALAAVTCVLLSPALVQAASASTQVWDPGSGGQTSPLAPVPAPTVRVIDSGMAGWQITLIALGAAVVAAIAAVCLDRALAARRSASATTA